MFQAPLHHASFVVDIEELNWALEPEYGNLFILVSSPARHHPNALALAVTCLLDSIEYDQAIPGAIDQARLSLLRLTDAIVTRCPVDQVSGLLDQEVHNDHTADAINKTLRNLIVTNAHLMAVRGTLQGVMPGAFGGQPYNPFLALPVAPILAAALAPVAHHHNPHQLHPPGGGEP